MSRYIKSISTTKYTGKKSYLNATATSFTLPAGSTEAKVLVFGGGGNSCSVTLCDCCQFNCCNSGCCQCCRNTYALFQTGAGGGYTEKVFGGVSGATACVIVGAAEGSSSFCVAGLGTITATGATATGSGGSRVTVPGCGLCGDINRCGGVGSCDVYCNLQCCNYCYFTGPNCFIISRPAGILMSGATPGNSVANGCCGTLGSGEQVCCCYYCCVIYNYGYGCSVYTGQSRAYCMYTSWPSGYGACPVSSDTYYGFDWDIIGGSIVCTAAQCGQTVSLTQCYCCYCNCNCSLSISKQFCLSAAGQATLAAAPGVTGSGGPGSWTGAGYNGTGGIGGGGAGICLPYDVGGNPASCYGGRSASGGPGMIIVYY